MKTFKFIAALCGVAAFVCSCEKEDSKTNDEGKEPVPVKDYLIHELEFIKIEDCAFSAGEIIAVAA